MPFKIIEYCIDVKDENTFVMNAIYFMHNNFKIIK